MASNEKSQLVIKLAMPIESHDLFNFIVLTKNMPLFEGFGMVPGIKNVVTSHENRKVGTIDKIYNEDGSSHQSVTEVLVPGKRYQLSLSQIELSGLKKKFATPIISMKEDWIISDIENYSLVERSLTIIHSAGFLKQCLVRYIIIPQLRMAFYKHHKNIISAFKQK